MGDLYGRCIGVMIIGDDFEVKVLIFNCDFFIKFIRVK